MTPTYARWVLASAFQKSQSIDEMAAKLRKYRGAIPEQKMKQLEETKKKLEWAIERATKVILTDQVRS